MGSVPVEKLKLFFADNFERILVLTIILGAAAINYWVPYKFGFLNFFYLPVLMAGYYTSKRFTVLTAILCILVVIFFTLAFPNFIMDEMKTPFAIIGLLSWSCFLLLTSAVIGYLYEEKEARIKDLKAAYIGILEILSKYLESYDQYTQGHSVRVAHLSEEIAREMGLPHIQVENIKAAALLHDIGKTEISMDIIHKATRLSNTERDEVNTHSERGARILTLVDSVLKDAIPLVIAHHEYYFTQDSKDKKDIDIIPLGAAVIAVADAYDAIITDRPYRAGKQPWKAFEEIEQASGKQFHPDTVKALKRVLMFNKKYTEETP